MEVDFSEALDDDFLGLWPVIVMGTFRLVSEDFFFVGFESMENVEFVRARLTLEFVTTEPFDFAFNLLFESCTVLLNKAFDLCDKEDAFDVCLRLRGASAEVLTISRPREEIATVTFKDFCSDFEAAVLGDED